MPGMRIAPQPQNVFVTRLHVRYDKAHFPEDLVFQETGDRTNFQGRYVMRHAVDRARRLRRGRAYRRELVARREREAQTLASLTGWAHRRHPPRTGHAARRGPGRHGTGAAVVAADLAAAGLVGARREGRGPPADLAAGG